MLVRWCVRTLVCHCVGVIFLKLMQFPSLPSVSVLMCYCQCQCYRAAHCSISVCVSKLIPIEIRKFMNQIFGWWTTPDSFVHFLPTICVFCSLQCSFILFNIIEDYLDSVNIFINFLICLVPYLYF